MPAGPVHKPEYCPESAIRVKGECVHVFYPPKNLPDKWATNWKIDARGPIWYPPHEVKWKEPWKIYELEGWNTFGDGVIGATGFVGSKSDEVAGVLTTFIKERGGVPDIQVVDVGALEHIGGYQPSGGFSPSDTIVLTADAKGNVIATGRVPAARNTRNVGAALPAAVSAAADAKGAAIELRGLTETVKGQVAALDTRFTGLKGDFTTLQGEFQSYKGGTFDASGYGVRIMTMERQLVQLEDVKGRMSSVEGKVDVLQKIPFRGTTGIDSDLGRGIAEFARTTVAAMRSLPDVQNRTFQRHATAAEKAGADLEAALAADNPQIVTDATLALLSTIRTLVKASGVGAEHGRRLDSQLRSLSGLIT